MYVCMGRPSQFLRETEDNMLPLEEGGVLDETLHIHCCLRVGEDEARAVNLPPTIYR